MKFIIAALCLVTIVGCSGVSMKEPFPDSKLTPEERKQLHGNWVWLHDETFVLYIRFNDDGVPWMFNLVGEDDDLRLEKRRLHFAKRNDTLYFSLAGDPDQPDKYHFGEVRLSDNEVVVWGPDSEFFVRQVENGTVKGSVEDKPWTSVSLEIPSSAILELISINSQAIDYKEPSVFRKLE